MSEAQTGIEGALITEVAALEVIAGTLAGLRERLVGSPTPEDRSSVPEGEPLLRRIERVRIAISASVEALQAAI